LHKGKSGYHSLIFDTPKSSQVVACEHINAWRAYPNQATFEKAYTFGSWHTKWELPTASVRGVKGWNWPAEQTVNWAVILAKGHHQ
jgi:hypothetical protein